MNLIKLIMLEKLVNFVQRANHAKTLSGKERSCTIFKWQTEY